MGQVKIPYKLFLELVRYHLGEVPADENYIRKTLQEKLEKLVAREKYKTNLAKDKET